MAGEQLARDRWSRDRLLAHQAERLRALIAHAVAASPYYRDLLGPDATGGDVPLSELPTLPKATLMDDFDRIVTDPRLRRAELAAHLSGPAAELLEVRQYQVVHDPAGLHVAVVLREGVPADTPARVRAALALQLHDAGAVPPPIEVTPVAELRRDPGHGAKLKLIRSAATGSSPG